MAASPSEEEIAEAIRGETDEIAAREDDEVIEKILDWANLLGPS